MMFGKTENEQSEVREEPRTESELRYEPTEDLGGPPLLHAGLRAFSLWFSGASVWFIFTSKHEPNREEAECTEAECTEPEYTKLPPM